MKNLLRTTDPTLIAFVSALLDGEGIEFWHLDVHMSVLDGGIGALPQRLTVLEDDFDAASRVLRDHKIDSGY